MASPRSLREVALERTFSLYVTHFALWLALLLPVIATGSVIFLAVRSAITGTLGPDAAAEIVQGSLAAVFRSGLKLDQAGLELANVGITQLFVREGAGIAAADKLRRIRGLTGSGLTLDELAALSAPWFLDRTYLRHYTAAIFAHNAALGSVIGKNSTVFEERSHPSLVSAGAEAPRASVSRPGGGHVSADAKRPSMLTPWL